MVQSWLKSGKLNPWFDNLSNRKNQILGINTKMPGPAIILIDPQLGENIGMVARAMLNCGLTDLRLVRPRDGWPNEKAGSAASGADLVLKKATLHSNTSDAIKNLNILFAATNRRRDMSKLVVNPQQAAREIIDDEASAAGVLFGCEANGLSNDDITLANTILSIPLNPDFSSLNLSQAVLLFGYEYFKIKHTRPPAKASNQTTQPATKKELRGLYEQFEEALDNSGFFYVREKRPKMVRNLRNLIQRARPTEQEVKTLRGVIKSLRNSPLL